MKNKGYKFTYFLMNLYMLLGVLPFVLLSLGCFGLAWFCFACGPSSILIAISHCGFAENGALVMGSLLWLVIFTLSLLIIYIVVLITRKFLIFLGAIAANTISVFALFIATVAAGSVGSNFAYIFTGVVGIIYTLVFLASFLYEARNVNLLAIP